MHPSDHYPEPPETPTPNTSRLQGEALALRPSVSLITIKCSLVEEMVWRCRISESHASANYSLCLLQLRHTAGLSRRYVSRRRREERTLRKKKIHQNEMELIQVKKRVTSRREFSTRYSPLTQNWRLSFPHTKRNVKILLNITIKRINDSSIWWILCIENQTGMIQDFFLPVNIVLQFHCINKYSRIAVFLNLFFSFKLQNTVLKIPCK